MIDMLRKIIRTGIVTESVPFRDKSGYATIGVELQIRGMFGRSLHIRHVDSGSCNGCDFEISMLLGPHYDIRRFGIDFVASPRHADLLLVTGGVTRHLEEAVKRTYQATAHPKMVVAVGDCACGAGTPGKTYANFGNVGTVLPVFVRVPGCPPRPREILEGIFSAIVQYEKLREGETPT